MNNWHKQAGYEFIEINGQYIIRKDESSPALYVSPIFVNQTITHVEVTDLNRTIHIVSEGDVNNDYFNAVNQFTRTTAYKRKSNLSDDPFNKSAAGIKSKKKRNKKRKSKNTKKKS